MNYAPTHDSSKRSVTTLYIRSSPTLDQFCQYSILRFLTLNEIELDEKSPICVDNAVLIFEETTEVQVSKSRVRAIIKDARNGRNYVEWKGSLHRADAG